MTASSIGQAYQAASDVQVTPAIIRGTASLGTFVRSSARPWARSANPFAYCPSMAAPIIAQEAASCFRPAAARSTAGATSKGEAALHHVPSLECCDADGRGVICGLLQPQHCFSWVRLRRRWRLPGQVSLRLGQSLLSGARRQHPLQVGRVGTAGLFCCSCERSDL